jgi:GxxExxY protein
VPQHPIAVYFRDERVGEFYADFFVDNIVLVELKAIKAIAPEHQAQITSSQRASMSAAHQLRQCTSDSHEELTWMHRMKVTSQIPP